MPLKVNSTSTVLCDGGLSTQHVITRKYTAACAIYAVVFLRYVVAKNNLHN